MLKKDTYGLWRNLPALVRRGAIVVVGSIVLLLVSSCGGGEPSEQTPAPSFDLRSPSEGTIAPTPPPGDTPLRLVMQESGATEDKIWRISPSNPTNREQVATIKHRDGWSVRSSLSPDSRSIAYIAVPEGATDASYQGELFMLDLKRQETELVYRGVDLRFRPMWTPDSKSVVYRATRMGSRNLFQRTADGSGEEVRLATSENVQTPGTFTAEIGRASCRERV